MSFWTRTDRSAMLQDPAITEIQSLLKYVGIVLLTGSMIWQGIVMMYKKKLDPLVSTGLGLLSFVGWSSLGGTVAVLLNEAGIALAGQVLDKSIDTFAKTVGDSLLGQVGAATGSTFFLSIILFFLSCIQWVLGFFRQGALVILLALLPTAAAGQLNESTKPWLKKVLSWCLSLILYQPIAAIIFAIGLQLIGGQDLSSVLVGMAVIALAIISMPTMLRFFDWGGQKLTTGGGGGGGAMALGAAGSALGGASGLSKFMDKSGPGSQGNDSSGAVPVAPAHQGDGPGGPSDSGSDQEGGAQSPSGGPSTGEQGGTGMPEPGGSGGDPTSAATGAVGAEAGTGAAATGSAGTTAAAGGGGAMAAAGPAGAAVAGAQAIKEGGDQAVGAVTGAMTDGAGESS
jgi:type IV secretion system protein TrbL